ncbi:ferrous iron transporter B [Clostridium aminobutyricum]|uniref:ferrous iron transporter B n=1 Tax=Clostridium aminobutyricum TaxID=33953 RepID=UPI0031451CC1
MELEIKRQHEEDKVIALTGNPNVGKSTIFNFLTGMHQHTGNWPGKTVETAQGKYCFKGREYILVDLPGSYSLHAKSAEEEVARDFIYEGAYDAVVIVCDATCMERNLNLVIQTLAVTSKVIVCVNLLDEAKRKNIHVDLTKLQEMLGVPVIGTAAAKREGVQELLEAIEAVVTEHKKEKIGDPVQDHDPCVKTVKKAEVPIQAEHIWDQVGKVIDGAEIFGSGYSDRDRRIDSLLTNKITGFPIMLATLLAVFWITITGANYPSQWLNSGLFYLENRMLEFCQGTAIPKAVYEMAILGVYRVVAWVVSVMLPPMAIFFPLFTLLEDLGYLPRVAFNLDKYFKKCSACGKQALTMCMGFGCNAVGTMGCRIIDSPRERLIAMLTNNFMPCNGRFPTLIALLTMFFIVNIGGSGEIMGSSLLGGLFRSLMAASLLTVVILMGIVMTFLTSYILSKTLLVGVPSSFTLELPPYRKPQFGQVIVRSIFDRTIFVLRRAVTVAAPAGLLIWFLANATYEGQSLLLICSNFLDPFASYLGMDGVILLAFILGMPANEIVVPIMIMIYASSGMLIELDNTEALKELLLQHGWTWITAISVMMFSLMHWPCATTLLTIMKETKSIRWTAMAFILPTITGILVCFLFNLVVRIL